MKSEIHPSYNFVVVKDAGSDFAFLTRSTATSEKKTTWTDGKEYPLITVEISSASHPFYTGKQKLMDAEGRVEKFMQKYGMKKK